MKNKLILLVVIIALFLVTSLALNLIYGPSFPFLAGEDCWMPDGTGGWCAHGHPSDPPPDQPSVAVPLVLVYLPIFLPAALLIVFTLTPLRRKLETAAAQAKAESGRPESADDQRAVQ
jgi:hypothetical protein